MLRQDRGRGINTSVFQTAQCDLLLELPEIGNLELITNGELIILAAIYLQDGTGLLKHRKLKVRFLETDCNRQMVVNVVGSHFFYSFLFLLNFFYSRRIPLVIQPLFTLWCVNNHDNHPDLFNSVHLATQTVWLRYN